MFVRADYPDVLYLVKPGEHNPELKYSLRSLKNLNHGRVFLAGYKPSWVGDRYDHIPVAQHKQKYENARNNLTTALQDTRLSEEFVLMNDDFFIMKPTRSVPVLRRLKDIDHYVKLFEDVDPDGYYVKAMKQTREMLRTLGCKGRISSYELHVPMLFSKTKLSALLGKLPPDFPLAHIRTLYGNYYRLAGRRVADVKCIQDGQQVITYNERFLSSIDESFAEGKIGEYIRKTLAKVLIFSHANDPDGLACVVLAQLAFPEVEYVLTNNPQADIIAFLREHSIDNDYDYVFITDIYPGKPVLKALPDAYWFDHSEVSCQKIIQHDLTMKNARVYTTQNGRPTCATEIMHDWLREQGLLSRNMASFVEQIRREDTWSDV